MEIKTNQILLTKDGRVFGNAIVTNVEKDIIYAKTDYGSDIILNINELNNFFYLADELQMLMVENHKHYVKL